MGLAAAGAGLLGAGVSAIGSISQAHATAASDQYQAQVADNNSIIASQNATATQAAGDIAAQNSGLKTRAALGAQTAAIGANGVDVNTGSAAAVRQGTAQTGYLDALTIRSNAARQAYGYETQAVSDVAQADLDRKGASNASTAGDIGAATSLLSGASSVGRSYATYQNASGGGFNLGTG